MAYLAYAPSAKRPCPKCKTEYFPTPGQIKWGSYICGPCNAKKALAWKDKNREKVRALDRAKRAEISAEKMREDWERVITIIPANLAPRVEVKCNSIWSLACSP